MKANARDIFAARLKARRKELGLNQAEIARKSGLTAQTICMYERAGNSKGNPTLGNIAAIAEALQVSIDWLCGVDTPANFKHRAGTYGEVIQPLLVLLKQYPDLMRLEELLDEDGGKRSVISFTGELDEFMLRLAAIRALCEKEPALKEAFGPWMREQMRDLGKKPLPANCEEDG